MNAIHKQRSDHVVAEIGESLIQLEEEIKRLKKENKHLMELLVRINEEMHITTEFWRSAYLSLAKTSTLNERRMGEAKMERQNPIARKELQEDRFRIVGD